MTRETLSLRARIAARRGAADCFLCEIDTPDGTERYWSGIGPLQWRGVNYVGVGGVAAVSGLSSDASVFIQTVTLSLAIDNATSRYAKGGLKGYEARLWLALMDDEWQIIPDPVLVSNIVLDTATEAHDGAQAQVRITGQTGFVTLEQPARLLWTQEQLAYDFPGVTGFDRMPGDVAKEISWGPS